MTRARTSVVIGSRPGRRLVEEEDLRLQRDGAREADAPPHAARELRRALPLDAGEPHQVEALGHARADLVAASSSCAASSGKAMFSPTRHRVEERPFLERHPEAPPDLVAPGRGTRSRGPRPRSPPSRRRASRSPIMCLRRTLFPVPDLPRMTSDSPFATARSSPSRTTFGPKLFERPVSRISGGAPGPGRCGRAQKSTFVRKKSETRMASDPRTTAARRRAAHPFRPARRVEAAAGSR